MSIEERLEDHIERLYRAKGNLMKLLKASTNTLERARLQGKVEGVDLALGYLLETERVSMPREMN